MMLGLIHYRAPGDTTEEFVRWAAGAGFECVELRHTDLMPEGLQEADYASHCKDLKALMDELNLVTSGVSLGNDFVYLADDMIAEQVERTRGIAELTKIMDCRIFRTEGGQPKDSVPEEKYAEAIIKCVRATLPVCEDLDVVLAIDNHGVVSNNYELQLEVFETLDSEYVGSNMDTMNYRWFGYEVDKLPEIYEAIAPWVKHTHMKDGRNARPDYKGAALGEGEIPLDTAVAALKKAGYDGAYCAEYEGSEDGDTGYRKCLDWLKANI
ncbi:MAG: sugar phosphate isomerase/epimerase [candidate division WS1 bacterium]|jgi:sugar phosphate isomerase/epimerase|nr:sugar phosphate isomerase/epimerase [candidate division WS1 bacterium]